MHIHAPIMASSSFSFFFCCCLFSNLRERKHRYVAQIISRCNTDDASDDYNPHNCSSMAHWMMLLLNLCFSHWNTKTETFVYDLLFSCAFFFSSFKRDNVLSEFSWFYRWKCSFDMDEYSMCVCVCTKNVFMSRRFQQLKPPKWMKRNSSMENLISFIQMVLHFNFAFCP